MKDKVISLPYIFQVLYVLCCSRPRYQVSVHRTIGPLVFLVFIMQQLPKKITKKQTHLLSSKELRCPPFVYFDNRYSNHSADGIFDIAALTVHFVVKLSFSHLSVRQCNVP